MKRSVIPVAALCLTLTLAACGASGQADIPAETPEQIPSSTVTPAPAVERQDSVYADVLGRYETALAEQWDRQTLSDAGLSILCADGYGGNAAGKLGYLFTDLDGDGGDELLIGVTGSDPFYANMIYDLYTIVDGQAVQLFSGWERNRWYLRSDNTLLNEGSSSAFYSFWQVYALRNGALTPVEALEHDFNRNQEQPWFRHIGGRVENGGENLSTEDGETLAEQYAASRLPLDFVPFAASAKTDKSA